MTHDHIIVNSSIHFTINPETRVITTPSNALVLVQGDHNSKRYAFEIPKFVEGHDMSLCNHIEIHYDNNTTNGKKAIEGVYIVDDYEVNEDTVVFSWLISGNVTKLPGIIQFWISFTCTDEDDTIIYSWGTDIFNGVKVVANNRNTESVIQLFPDVLEQWRDAIFDEIDDISGGEGISVTGATVGQTVKISEVDESGKPTAWEPTDFSSKSAYDYAKEAGYTGTEEEFAERLARQDVVLRSSETPPYVVAQLVADGIPVSVRHHDSTYGDVFFTGFIYSPTMNAVVSSGLNYVGTDDDIVTMRYSLVGNISKNTWYSEFDNLATSDDVQNSGGNAAVDSKAVNELIDTKLHSVASYGAKGDGSTDDTAAFQDALANNRVVMVPGGTYKLSGELVIRDNCQLELSQDTVLQFTQTAGNCISMKMLANLKGNHATIIVPYSFTGNVIYVSTSLIENVKDVPPFTQWDPMWKAGRYITNINICKIDSRGFHYSVDGKCNGVALYVHTDGNDVSTFQWGNNFSGLRIAGAFDYGIRILTEGSHEESGWNHEMRVEGFIDGARIGVSLENTNNAYLSTIVQPRRAYTTAGEYIPYAECGIWIENSINADLSGSRVWDWDSQKSLWEEGGIHQAITMIGDCSGAIINEYRYYASPKYDVRSFIYTDTPSNLERLTILQEPFTRWFKPIDSEPFFYNGYNEKRLLLKDEFDECFMTDRVAQFDDKLSKAIDKNRNVFNGIGYVRYGNRWNMNTGELNDTPYMGCTGLIPVTSGQTIYAQGLSLDDGSDYCGVVWFDSNFNNILSSNRTHLVEGTQSYFTEYEVLEDGFKITLKNKAELAYVALNFARECIGARPVIAIDEEIKFAQEGFLADGIKVKSENVIGADSGVSDLHMLTSPNGTKYILSVSDEGVVSAAPIT